MIIFCRKVLFYYEEEGKISRDKLNLLIEENAVECLSTLVEFQFNLKDVAFSEEISNEVNEEYVGYTLITLRFGDSYYIDIEWSKFKDIVSGLYHPYVYSTLENLSIPPDDKETFLEDRNPATKTLKGY